MTDFLNQLFCLVTEAARIIDDRTFSGGSDGDHFRWRVWRGDLGDNIIADVTVLTRPSASNERCTIEVFACVSTANRSLGAISGSSWAAIATKEKFAEEREALKASLTEAIHKAWEDLPGLAERLPEANERIRAATATLKNMTMKVSDSESTGR